MTPQSNDILTPNEIGVEQFKEDVLDGLMQPEKHLPCKYFYDERGSRLFETITTLEEYYPTRTEITIMREHIGEIASAVGSDVKLIEFGSGSSTKTEFLLEHCAVKSYVPIDINAVELKASAGRLHQKYPHVHITPLQADYTDRVVLPDELPGERKVVYFPGSTIGNFHPHEASRFLDRITALIGPNGGLLIGVDLKKDTAILERAYNDAAGVTAEFNLNLIDRINQVFAPDPPLTGFTHKAIYNEQEGCIEMRLVNSEDQVVLLDGVAVAFRKGEYITTEYSYKYSIEEFSRLAEGSGLRLRQVWTDQNALFSVQYYAVD